MTGAKHFTYSDNSVSFQFKGSRKTNALRITLDSSDTYTMKFFKINSRKLTVDTVREIEYVYCDQLAEIFERETGLYLHF